MSTIRNGSGRGEEECFLFLHISCYSEGSDSSDMVMEGSGRASEGGNIEGREGGIDPELGSMFAIAKTLPAVTCLYLLMEALHIFAYAK